MKNVLLISRLKLNSGIYNFKSIIILLYTAKRLLTAIVAFLFKLRKFAAIAELWLLTVRDGNTKPTL
ncbi:uncharacterized protein PRCAT00003823001 [Priceomyces carsonii]|uniref:uncharacterized protein n=1 Tax=Priceomyces carsonii TaxID=28549 RepID=UPI002ED86E31|nr:unnamed protein product [Priceomyces carsonii]